MVGQMSRSARARYLDRALISILCVAIYHQVQLATTQTSDNKADTHTHTRRKDKLSARNKQSALARLLLGHN